jgi:hypothetical protein
MPIISSMLWFDSEAEEAANFYVSIFPNSRILAVVHRPPNVPAPGGEVMVVDFELDGVRVSALNGGPMFQFSEAFSYTVHCKDQAEIDYYWAEGSLRLFLANHARAPAGDPGRGRSCQGRKGDGRRDDHAQAGPRRDHGGGGGVISGECRVASG